MDASDFLYGLPCKYLKTESVHFFTAPDQDFITVAGL